MTIVTTYAYLLFVIRETRNLIVYVTVLITEAFIALSQIEQYIEKQCYKPFKAAVQKLGACKINYHLF